MKRIFSLLAVMAIMAAMVAASAMPAFAYNPRTWSCFNAAGMGTPIVHPSDVGDFEAAGYVCTMNPVVKPPQASLL